ncbi:hypothetical protein N0V91_005506 [Didymella pomorum]|uniref:Uncharacterized protein n=1 Tax=Didymella pomorum TaxID=749634 RepID=A0A9W8ZET4_9PLEO|nr:hypothetical protein N0V91_005506 [Didymella pomorum]
MKHENEVYVKSFPSAWLSAAKAPPNPTEHVSASAARSQRSARSSVPELESARNSSDGTTTEDGTSSDTELGPTPQGRVSSAPPTPRHSADEGRGATTKKQDAGLTVPKSRRLNAKRRNVSAPASEYSTFYPASWTIAPHRNVSQPSPAVKPANEPSFEPAAIPVSATVHAAWDRSRSTNSQEDVGPVPPTRRLFHRKSQTIAVTSPQSARSDWRSKSVHVPTWGRMQQSLSNGSYSTEHPPGPVRETITRQGTPGRHQSSNSTYSTFEPNFSQSQRFTSSKDASANRRVASKTYSEYGNED